MADELSILFLSYIGNKPIELVFDVSPDMPAVMYGDTKRLSQIMINLVGNATKYTDSGYVEIKVEPKNISDDSVVVAVSVIDSGRGIKKEDYDKIFKSFSQIDTKKNRDIEGTGLGLAIVKNLVNLMGGEIHVESEYGKGSCFYFDIVQKITDYKPVTKRGEDIESLKGAYYFESAYETESFNRISNNLNLDVTPVMLLDDIKRGGFDYFITDQFELANNIQSDMGDSCMVALLQNQMLHKYHSAQCSVINKPIYCANIARFLRRESQTSSISVDDLIFSAPNAKILIVDDMPMNLKVATALLQPLNMHIDTAANGKEALDMIFKNTYDMVFMDHMMPVMDGVEAVTEIRKHAEYESLPVVELSANATVEARKLFAESGFSDFISKPIDFEDIIACIRRFLPEDKIIEPDKSAPHETAVNDEISVDVDIPGIDNNAGIRNSGGKAIFMDLLTEVYRIIDEKCELIDEYYKSGDINNYTIQVHALKTTCRMIGAKNLSERFFELENLGKNNATDEINKLTPGVLNDFKALKPYLEPYAAKEDTPKEEFNRERFNELLGELKHAIEDFDLNASGEIMNELKAFEYDDDTMVSINRLDKLVSDLDFNEAVELINQLK